MDKFISFFTKFSIVSCIVIAILLLTLAGLLIFVPDILLKIVYYCLIAACVIGAVYLLVCATYAVIMYLKDKMKKEM